MKNSKNKRIGITSKTDHQLKQLVIAASCLLLAGLSSTGVFLIKKNLDPTVTQTDKLPVIVVETSLSSSEEFTEDSGSTVFFVDSPVGKLLAQANALASGYDYDAAIALLQSNSEYGSDPAIQETIAAYETARSSLVKVKISEVTHIFFHSLVVDNQKAFDGEDDSDGYNQVMTTTGEFEKILESLYEKGFVLVRMHDMAYETKDENGNTIMKPGTILLPEGKRPLVISQDDVCYYPYMDGDGFASRMIVGEDGKPT